MSGSFQVVVSGVSDVARHRMRCRALGSPRSSPREVWYVGGVPTPFDGQRNADAIATWVAKRLREDQGAAARLSAGATATRTRSHTAPYSQTWASSFAPLASHSVVGGLCAAASVFPCAPSRPRHAANASAEVQCVRHREKAAPDAAAPALDREDGGPPPRGPLHPGIGLADAPNNPNAQQKARNTFQRFVNIPSTS